MNRYPPPAPRALVVALIAVVLLLVVVASARAATPRAPGASAAAPSALAASPRARAAAVVCDVFGSRCSAAMRVARCETGGTYDRRALGGAGERGLFQIHPVHFGRLDESRLFELRYNALFAFRLSSGGRDWSAWTCRP